jgi:hypothetical protein
MIQAIKDLKDLFNNSILQPPVILLIMTKSKKPIRGNVGKMIKSIIVSLAVLFTTSVAFAESLKEDTVLKGRITQEDDKPILFEYDSSWKRIDKGSIEQIVKNDQPTNGPVTSQPGQTENKSETIQPQEEKQKTAADINSDDKRKSQWMFKISIDGAGTHKISNLVVNGQSVSSTDSTNVDNGISLTLERVYFPATNIGLGFGISYQVPRSQTNYKGDFYFIPVYGLFRVRTTPTDNNHYFYGTVQLGANYFAGDSEYKGSAKLEPGLYAGAGIGWVFSSAFQIELLYTSNNGSVTDTYYTNKISADVEYTKLSLSIGLVF